MFLMAPRLTIAAALAIGCGSAAAINKCTMADGKPVFQDAPCPVSSQKSETVKTWDSNLTGRARDEWSFVRNTDDMTGKQACLVLSPLTSPDPQRGGTKFIPARIVVVVGATSSTFGVRTGTDKDLFHNNLSGMGIKTNNAEFMPLDIKAGQHVVGSSQGASIIEAMSGANNARLRLRFWPYDTLYDTMTIDFAGYRQAYASAKQCAGIP